ncbi:T6SS effector BTH_I2691 family protein, partial [Variovorax boronicumulans]|uniref:T6SS effector BTH_I2691 family protein n=1 Tax=Variovorax boronicumulans TaxID=436515 RepID=UPI00295578CD
MPLLFTRYATAYSTNAEGLAALDQLRPSGQLQSKPGNVPLEAARYGLRMLRAGFLYIRIKRPGLTPEWSGYVVHPHGYLTVFDVKNPQDSKAHPACEVEMRGANMSMVWVADPQRVSALNYMFHPDPIDHGHLQRAIEPNLGKYTQSFDVKGWALGNTSQKDAVQPGLLNGQVMEFSALSTASVQKVGNEQHYGLMGTHGAERGWGNYSEARYGRHFEKTRHETIGTGNPEDSGVTDAGAVGGMAIGPYVAEVLGMRYSDVHGPRLKKIAELLQVNRGAVVACEDAIGIAQELSLHHLTAAIPYVAWLKKVDDEDEDPRNSSVTNQWKQTAGESIKTLECWIPPIA